MEALEQVDKKCKDSTFLKHDDYFQHENDTPFFIEHKWEGKIKSVKNEVIVARLFNAEENEWDELTLNKSEINESDIDLVKEGALVNFYIGSRKINGTIKREKKIKFRRIYLNNKIDQILDSFNSNSFTELFEEY